MSFKQAFSYLNKGLHEKVLKDESVDSKAPLGARIGGLIKFGAAPFIRSRAYGSLIESPSVDPEVITAISRVKFNGMQNGIFRFYLNTGDTGHGERFLQALVTPAGELVELMYCSNLTRIIPESVEEQGFWTGKDEDGLGCQEFSLNKGQLMDVGASNIDLAFQGDAETLPYQRADGSSDAFHPPVQGMEVRIDDAGGDHGLEQEIYFSPYSRNVGDGEEYLLISTEVVSSKNGDLDDREIHVDFMIGQVIDKASVTVI